MTNLPHTNRAKRALDVLADGGEFIHRLERNSYTGREQFQSRLKTADGAIVKGVGFSALHELKEAGLLAKDFDASTPSVSYYTLNKGA